MNGIGDIYFFKNGNYMVFDDRGNQIGRLQGAFARRRNPDAIALQEADIITDEECLQVLKDARSIEWLDWNTGDRQPINRDEAARLLACK